MSITFAGLFLAAAVGLVAIGLVGLLFSRNLFRMVLALALTEAGANLLLVMAGYRWDAVAPIVQEGIVGPMVDPVPQAMVLTAIVIGVGVQALAMTLVIRVYRRYGTLDIRTARERMLADLDAQAGVSPAVSSNRPLGERPLGLPTASTGKALESIHE